MAELITIARPYARAAYEYAVEHKVVADWNAMLHGLALIAKDKRTRHYLANPELSAEQAAEIFLVIGKELLEVKSGKNFLMLLAKNKRLILLPQLAELFAQLLEQDQAIVNAEVISAEPLTQAYKDKIIQSLEKRFNKTVQLHCHVDASLLAGAIVRVDVFVIDGSARGKLKSLEKELA